MSHDTRHLSEDALQGYLDGALPDAERDRVGEHVASCARCRSRLEAWELLFSELDGLDEIAPSTGFADRVMADLPRESRESLPWAARIAARLPAPLPGWLGLDGREEARAGHLTGEAIQEFLDGVLPRPAALTVEEHLHGCRACREEVDDWRAVMVQLDDVPHLAPSPDFGERVMAHVRVQSALAVAQPTLRERVASWIEALSPRTRRRMAGLAGAAVTPVATLALVAWVVFSHPLVTVGNLLSFVSLEAQDVGAATVDAVLGMTLESGLLYRAWDLLQTAGSAPGAVALGFTMFSAVTLVAVWVLYKNLITTSSVDLRYGHASL